MTVTLWAKIDADGYLRSYGASDPVSLSNWPDEPGFTMLERPPEVGPSAPNYLWRYQGGAWSLVQQPIPLAVIKAERNQKLAASDWTQIPDNPLTIEQRAAWALYRQAVREAVVAVENGGELLWPETPL